MSGEAGRALPRYKSHKEVWALKIACIDGNADGSATITPAEEGYGPFSVEARYMEKHEPKVGGYYVVYRDGYRSWSPASEFEDGYTKVS